MMMENGKKLNEIPESDLDSVSGGINWDANYNDIVGQAVTVTGDSGWRVGRITACYGDTFQVQFMDGKKPETAVVDCFGRIIG